jgi:hypothetical protein
MAAGMPWFGLAGYELAALAYLATAIVLIGSRREPLGAQQPLIFGESQPLLKETDRAA